MLSKRKLILALSITGIAISAYLAYAKITSNPYTCGLDGGCNIVQNSIYATLFGIPLGIWGMAYYFSVFVIFYLNQKNVIKNLLVIWGVLFSIYLTSIEAFVIHAYCLWCLGSALVTVLISLVHFTKKR